MATSRPIRALVIDDSAYNRVTLSRMLESHPQIKVVATAVNGEDGIKQVMRHRPDVVTLDLEMPIMDGFAFLRWLMHNLPTAVIAVSSRSSDRSVFKALELGAIDFIAKPGGRVSPRLEEIQKDLVSKVLQVGELRMDNLRRRLQEEQEDEQAPGPMPEACAKGIELIYQRLLETLKRAGLEPIETEGRLFDPNHHEAVQREQTEDAPDQTILGELQRGYNFKGKLLRPAWVKVAVHP